MNYIFNFVLTLSTAPKPLKDRTTSNSRGGRLHFYDTFRFVPSAP